MLKNSFKIFFMFMLVFSTLVSISSLSWFNTWMGLEINLLSFIPLMMNLNNPNSLESCMKYFLIQTLASNILLFFIIFSSFSNLKFYILSSCMMILSLSMKAGLVPFYFWLPSTMQNLSWMKNFILMTWQKMSPLMLISYYCETDNMNKINTKTNILIMMMIYVIAMLSIIVSSLSMINQTSLQKLMAYSSINHSAWMLFGCWDLMVFLTYFSMYFMLNFYMVFLFWNFKLNTISQTFKENLNGNIFIKLFFYSSVLAMSGLPPFAGFLPKLLTLQLVLSSGFYFLLWPSNYYIYLMVLCSLLSIYAYLKIFNNMFFLINKTSKINYYFMKTMFEKKNLNTFKINFLIICSIYSIFGFFPSMVFF